MPPCFGVDLVEVHLHALADDAECGQRAGLRADEPDLDRLAVGQRLGGVRRAVVGGDRETRRRRARSRRCRRRRSPSSRRRRSSRRWPRSLRWPWSRRWPRSLRWPWSRCVVSRGGGLVGAVVASRPRPRSSTHPTRRGVAAALVVVASTSCGDERQADGRRKPASDPRWIVVSLVPLPRCLVGLADCLVRWFGRERRDSPAPAWMSRRCSCSGRRQPGHEHDELRAQLAKPVDDAAGHEEDDQDEDAGRRGSRPAARRACPASASRPRRPSTAATPRACRRSPVR